MKNILNLKDKKAGLLLRDIYMVLIVGAIVVVFATMLVNDVADSYDNTNMSDDWGETTLNDWGASTTNAVGDNVSENMVDATVAGEDNLLKSFTTVSTVFSGIATVFKIIFGAPIYFASLVSAGFEFVGAPAAVVETIRLTVSVLLYLVIIFGIGTALLRGGKI